MTSIFNNHPFLKYFRFSIVSAVLYCIMVAIFIKDDAFSSSWKLYLGNILFAIVIAVFIYMYNVNRGMNAKAQVMVFAGHITAVMGILLSCVIIILLFSFLRPNVFHLMINNPASMENAPASLQGNARGLMLIVFMDAIFGNIAAASFISIILPFTAKRFQKSDSNTISENA